MAQRCELTGKTPKMGHNVSHANNKTSKKWHLNLKAKRYIVAELGKTVTLKLTTRAIRTIDKQGGITRAIMAAKLVDLSPRLQRLRRDLA